MAPSRAHGGPRGFERNGFNWWTEVASLGLAFSAIAAIAVLLLNYQEKPLPKWPVFISINTLIAVFTVLLKGALIYPIAEGIGEIKWAWFTKARPAKDLDRFDAVSRSPLGALKLLVRPRSLLATLGAAIIVLAMAIDPFTQQIVRYYPCMIPTGTEVASVPRTNNYTASGGHIAAGFSAMDAALSLSLSVGLLKPPANGSSEIAFHCPSGNCTFASDGGATYHSLAICTEVRDLSDKVSSNTSEAYALNTTDSAIVVQAGQQGLATATGSGFSQPEDGVFDYQVLMAACKDPSTGVYGPCDTKPIAFGTRLYPCVKAYNTTGIRNYILQEQVMSHFPLIRVASDNSALSYFSLAGDYPSTAGIDCSPSKQATKTKTAPALPSELGSYYVDASLSSDSLSSARWYDPGCAYEVGYDTILSLRGASGQFFSDNNTVSLMQGQPVGPEWLLQLYGAGKAITKDRMASYAQGVANAMTNVIRQGGDPSNSLPAKGAAMQTETCIAVQWPWLALPATLVLLTAIFLSATIVQSYRARAEAESTLGLVRRPWKSSTLPLLFSGSMDEARNQYLTLSSNGELLETYNGSKDAELRKGYSTRRNLMSDDGLRSR